VLFREKSGEDSASQIQAFTDTWVWNMDAEYAYNQLTTNPPENVAAMIEAMRQFIGTNDMMAYLVMMAQRMLELHRVLKSTGSLYLHCDPTASHYLKMLLDTVFGVKNFRNEIMWKRYSSHNDSSQGTKHFGRIHDVILFYSKTDKPTWTQTFMPYDPLYVEESYKHIEGNTGRRYTTSPLTGPGGAAKGNPVYEWNGHTRAWRYSQQTMQKLHDEGRLQYSSTGYVRQKRYLG
jgi:adenine specific DNA methylase Mod